MNSKLKKTGKVALILVTPTILVLIFFISAWLYKKYKKKPIETDKDVSVEKTEEIINK